jgi:hypothetical protein
MLQKYIWMLHIHPCCKSMFFWCFIRLLPAFHLDVVYVYSGFKSFCKCFRHMFQVFRLSFFCMLQLLLLDVLKVDRVLHMGCVGDVRGSADDVRNDAGPIAGVLACKPDMLGCSLAHLAPCPDDQIGRPSASKSGLLKTNSNILPKRVVSRNLI